MAQPLVTLPFSKAKYEIAKLLERKGFVEYAEVKGRKTKKTICLALKYDEQKRPAIEGLKRISKPGQRLYKGHQALRRVRGGYGVMLVSTSKGLMTGEEARKKKLGGEVVAEVW